MQKILFLKSELGTSRWKSFRVRQSFKNILTQVLFWLTPQWRIIRHGSRFLISLVKSSKVKYKIETSVCSAAYVSNSACPSAYYVNQPTVFSACLSPASCPSAYLSISLQHKLPFNKPAWFPVHQPACSLAWTCPSTKSLSISLTVHQLVACPSTKFLSISLPVH